MLNSCKMFEKQSETFHVLVAFFPSLKHNYPSSKVSDYIFDIRQLWKSGFSRVYSNCCCSCWFEPEILKIGQSSHKMYSNNILNFQESTTILNAHTKKSGNLSYASRIVSLTTIALNETLQNLFYCVEGSNITQINLSPVGWGCRLHQLHLCREVRLPQWVPCIWH